MRARGRVPRKNEAKKEAEQQATLIAKKKKGKEQKKIKEARRKQELEDAEHAQHGERANAVRGQLRALKSLKGFELELKNLDDFTDPGDRPGAQAGLELPSSTYIGLST
eukprot:850206-Prorocentrum_minimum.AAC.1